MDAVASASPELSFFALATSSSGSLTGIICDEVTSWEITETNLLYMIVHISNSPASNISIILPEIP